MRGERTRPWDDHPEPSAADDPALAVVYAPDTPDASRPRSAAFTAFVPAHADSLFGTAYLLTGRRDDAEDLLQDTLTALYPNWAKVEAADAPVAYVRRALVNRFLSQRRRRQVPLVYDAAERPERADPFDLAQAVVDRDLVWALLATLTERQRAAMVLRYFHGLSDAQIAAALRCRQATVRSLVSRGLGELRERSRARRPSRTHPTDPTDSMEPRR